MADKHPYMSGSGGVTQLVSQLRKSFPTTAVTADTLKKLGIAPQNETYVLNILKFIGILDSENKKLRQQLQLSANTITPSFNKSSRNWFASRITRCLTFMARMPGLFLTID